jgi:predicted Mrr-cat superfamily restriction endonuclease
MGGRAWGMKLGSGGICIPFCERHQIVGVGWPDIDLNVVAGRSRDELWEHIRKVYPPGEVDDRLVGNWTGQLYRFGRECTQGDYVLYYDPPKKQVRITRVISPLFYRDFELEDSVDIWHYRRVEYPAEPIPILDLYGSLKGKLLGPRISFWELSGLYETVDAIVRGEEPHLLAAPDVDIKAAYEGLREFVVRRLEALNERDWEYLVVDYLKAQGAQVDEQQVGGSRPIIDIEARFDHGELGEEIWRVQVKRLQSQKVDWPLIEQDLLHVGYARFCYVSVFGFTPEARQKADAEDVLLLEAGDFTRFLLGGKLRDSLRAKLQLPLR